MKENNKYNFITTNEVKEQYNADVLEIGSVDNYNQVLLLKGNTVVEADMLAWFKDILTKENKKAGKTLIIIDGNLSVNGSIAIGDDYFPCLAVLGNVVCDTLNSCDEFIHITGTLDVKYVLNGVYNGGMITVDGMVTVPYLINSDHAMELETKEGTIKINCFDNLKEDFDYVRDDLKQVIVPELLELPEDEDEYPELLVDEFIEYVKQGESPLIEGSKTIKKKLEEVQEAVISVSEIDLSNKKLKKIPEEVFENTALKKLNISNNDKLKSLSEKIGSLKELEVLDISNTSIKKIPKEIGDLQNLKHLNISTIGVVAGNISSIFSIPQSFVELKKLEFLDISYNTQIFFNYDIEKWESTQFDFPNALDNFQNLKTFISSGNNHKPYTSLTKLKKLEYFEMEGTNISSLREFPEYLTSIKSLKVLKLESHPLRAISSKLTDLINLEELNLNRSLAYLKEPIPNFSKLENLKKLNFSGLGGSSSSYPEINLLVDLLSMDLSQLNELYIYGWGEKKELNRETSTWEVTRANADIKLFEKLFNFKNLKVLDVSLNDLSEEFINELKKQLPNTEILIR